MNKIKTNIAILGSTGSIGQQTLDVIQNFPDRFNVIGLAGGDNIDLLSGQIEKFQPDYVYFKQNKGVHHKANFISMEEMASLPDVDLVIVATAGKAGFGPTFAAINAGKRI